MVYLTIANSLVIVLMALVLQLNMYKTRENREVITVQTQIIETVSDNMVALRRADLNRSAINGAIRKNRRTR